MLAARDPHLQLSLILPFLFLSSLNETTNTPFLNRVPSTVRISPSPCISLKSPSLPFSPLRQQPIFLPTAAWQHSRNSVCERLMGWRAPLIAFVMGWHHPWPSRSSASRVVSCVGTAGHLLCDCISALRSPCLCRLEACVSVAVAGAFIAALETPLVGFRSGGASLTLGLVVESALRHLFLPRRLSCAKIHVSALMRLWLLPCSLNRIFLPFAIFIHHLLLHFLLFKLLNEPTPIALRHHLGRVHLANRLTTAAPKKPQKKSSKILPSKWVTKMLFTWPSSPSRLSDMRVRCSLYSLSLFDGSIALTAAANRDG